MLVSKMVLIGAFTVAAGAAAFGMQMPNPFNHAGGYSVATHGNNSARIVPASTGSIVPSPIHAAEPLVVGSDKDYGWGPFRTVDW
jgi:hypothetical protein